MTDPSDIAPGQLATSWRRSILSQWALLATGLVVISGLAVALLLTQAVSRQAEAEVDRRLVEGAVAFQGLLEDRSEDVRTAAHWLAADPRIAEAVEAGDFGYLHQRMAELTRLPDIDELLIARPDGRVVAWVRTDGAALPIQTLTSPAFVQARAGRVSAGVGSDLGDTLHPEAYQPLGATFPAPVVRAASFLDANLADRFRSRTGLHLSLFRDQARVVTTLRDPDGQPLAGIGADPETYREVVGEGRPVLRWRDLPIGRLRSYSVPLEGGDGARLGMVSVQLPVEAIELQVRAILAPLIPVGLAIVLLAAAGAYLVFRQIYTPILALARAAVRLGQGDLVTPIAPVTQSELAPLARELEKARASLHQRVTALAQEEARQRALLNALSEPVLTTDAQGRVTGWNSAAARLFGGEAHPLSGRSLEGLAPFVDRRSEGPWLGRVAIPGGGTIDVQVTCAELPAAALSATQVYVLHDVSQQAQLVRLRERLLFHLAHELRGPVTVLENALDLLETDATARGRMLPLARRMARQISSLMLNLLSAANIQAGRFLVQPRPVPLRDVAREAIELVAHLAEPRQQIVASEIDEPCEVMADPEYTRLALVNLLANACKYSPEGSVIEVRAHSMNGQVRVEVRDPGPGIPPAHQARVFEAFYRLPSAGPAAGLGLGLAIVKEVAEAHGGRTGIESAPGAGATVWFTLPRVGP